MNIGFINQNISPRVNMGLAYVMSAAAQQHRVFFWDAGRHRSFSAFLLKAIARAQPAVIAFSVNNFTFNRARQWAALIKQHYPHITLIFGGVYPTLLPAECLNHAEVDIICIGEGEYALDETLSCIKDGRPPAGVAGIWYKTADGGIQRNPPRPFLTDIDRLPEPDWDLWDIEFYLRQGGLVRNSINVLASRGCCHDCRFCTVPAQRRQVPGQFHRVRSPEHIIREVQKNFDRYQHLGLRYLVFSDPLFGADTAHTSELLRQYRRSGLAAVLPWLCETRPEIVTPALARQAAASGCVAVSLGIESADPGIRNRVLGKNISDAAIAGALDSLRQAGLPLILYLMLCSPGETVTSARKTIRFAAAQDAIKTYFLFYLPLPCTALAAEANDIAVKHRDTRHDDGFWNRPNIRLTAFKRGDYARLILELSFVKARLFVRHGWRLRRWRFVRDIIAFLCGRERTISLFNPYALNELYQTTVLRYFLDDRQQRWHTTNTNEHTLCQP